MELFGIFAGSSEVHVLAFWKPSPLEGREEERGDQSE
jgi:hypothetical protein